VLFFVKLLAPVIAGGAAAGAVTFGVVQTQTSAPEQNPASTEIISYGDKS
jgi:hypothetical protein